MGSVVRDTVTGIWRHPARSVLIALTFALGFASALVTVATVEGGRRTLRTDLRALGTDVIVALNPIHLTIPFITQFQTHHDPVDASAVRGLRDELDGAVRAVVPLHMEMSVVEAGTKSITAPLLLTMSDFRSVFAKGMLSGEFFPAGGSFTADRPIPVALDEALARDLTGGAPASIVGSEVTLTRGGKTYRARVTGVMKDPISFRKQVEAFDVTSRARTLTARRLEFRNIYAPIDLDRDAPSAVLVQVKSMSEIDGMLARVKSFFGRRGARPGYFVQRNLVAKLIEIVDRFSFLAHFLWVVDLAVVLLLSATIALLAVEERFREVAIRRVEGATVRAVVLPVVGEGVALALVALLPGALLALGIERIFVEPLLTWPPYLPWQAITGMPVLLVAVSVAAHLLPARRIARLSPARVLSEVAP